MLHSLLMLNSDQIVQDSDGSPFRDPPIPLHRGRPRTARLKSSIEQTPGRSKGGGGKRKFSAFREATSSRHPHASTGITIAQDLEESTGNHTTPTRSPQRPPITQTPERRSRHPRCSICGGTDHNRLRCYEVTAERQEKARGNKRQRRR